MWCGVVCMRVRGRNRLLDVQPLEEIAIISTLVPGSGETKARGGGE